MPFVIDDIYLPATITASQMTDGEFAAFCAEHPDLFFEMSAEGEIIVMPPTYTTGGASCSRIGARLAVWAEQDGRGISSRLRSSERGAALARCLMDAEEPR